MELSKWMAAVKNKDGIASILMTGDADAVRMFPSVSEKGKGQDGAQKSHVCGLEGR